MFVRKLGNQVLLLRSYRDGSGRVRQRCLAKFRSSAAMNRDWDDLETAEPSLKSQLRALRNPAAKLLNELESEIELESLECRVASHSKSLLRLLSDYAVKLPELELLQMKLEEILNEKEPVPLGDAELSVTDSPEPCPPKHEVFDKESRQQAQNQATLRQWVQSQILRTPERRLRGNEILGTQAYLEALDSLSPLTEDESIATLAERVRVRPDLDSLTRYALALGESGRVPDCIDALCRLPGGDAWANLNRAAVFWKLGEPLLTLQCLLKGLAKEVYLLPALRALRKGWQPTKGLEYWQKFGHLWDESSRDFLLRLYKEPLIKIRLKSVLDGTRLRTLVHPHFQPRLLQKMGTCDVQAEFHVLANTANRYLV